MEKYQEVGLDHPIGITTIIGPNNSHTSTLLTGLRRTVTFVRGFAFLNMDEAFNLLTPEDALSGFFQFLRHQHDEFKKTNHDAHKSFRHTVVSNFPKTGDQMKRLLEFCPELRLAYIDAPRDDADEAYNLAMEFKRDHKDQFILVNTSRKIHYQAELIIRAMDVTHEEMKSMRHAVFAEKSQARLFFDGIKLKQGPARLAPPEPGTSKPSDKVVTPSHVFTGMRQATY
jgi:hypothetical protein